MAARSRLFSTLATGERPFFPKIFDHLALSRGRRNGGSAGDAATELPNRLRYWVQYLR
jgi:hypothetical protein